MQQKQGRTQATEQLSGGVAVNTDSGLEREADEMGERSLRALAKSNPNLNRRPVASGNAVIQLMPNEDIKKNALAVIDKFKNDTSTETVWTEISKEDFINRLIDLINNPTEINQGKLGFCGPAAIGEFMLEQDPEEFVKMAIALFTTGKTTLKGSTTYDVNGTINLNINPEKYYIKSVDFIMLSSMTIGSSLSEEHKVKDGIITGLNSKELEFLMNNLQIKHKSINAEYSAYDSKIIKDIKDYQDFTNRTIGERYTDYRDRINSGAVEFRQKKIHYLIDLIKREIELKHTLIINLNLYPEQKNELFDAVKNREDIEKFRKENFNGFKFGCFSIIKERMDEYEQKMDKLEQELDECMSAVNKGRSDKDVIELYESVRDRMVVHHSELLKVIHDYESVRDQMDVLNSELLKVKHDLEEWCDENLKYDMDKKKDNNVNEEESQVTDNRESENKNSKKGNIIKFNLGEQSDIDLNDNNNNSDKSSWESVYDCDPEKGVSNISEKKKKDVVHYDSDDVENKDLIYSDICKKLKLMRPLNVLNIFNDTGHMVQIKGIKKVDDDTIELSLWSWGYDGLTIEMSMEEFFWTYIGGYAIES